MCEYCGGLIPLDKKHPEKRFCDRTCASRWREARIRERPKPEPVLAAVCECGCGTPMPEYDKNGRKRRYIYRHNPKTRTVQLCQTCGEPILQYGKNKFCSKACFGRSRALAKVDLVCLVCGKDYPCFPYRAESSKYCSKECWSRRAAIKTCLACGGPFTGSNRKYCSQFCRKTHMVGERAAQWKGGATLANERARRSAELRKWRLAVYKRDGYRCQDCGTRNELHAHHIKYWSTHPELRFVVSNGVTVCIDCHGKRHGRNLRKFRRKHYGPPPVPAPATATRPRAVQLALFELSNAG